MKINKIGQKSIVFLVLISFILLFVTCFNDEEDPLISYEDPFQDYYPYTPYTVIYNKNAVDATGTMENSTFSVGVSVPLSINSFVRDNYCFLGWARTPTSTTEEYENGQSIIDLTTGGKTITLYAVWHETYTVEVTKGSTLAEKITWIKNNAESYTTYIIENTTYTIDNDYTTIIDFRPKKQVTIHLKGSGYLSYNKNRKLEFKNVNLILDGNITLSWPLSMNNANLIINTGTITNTVSMSNGLFIMNGGIISCDKGDGVNDGDGVSITGGTFIMNGGKISSIRKGVSVTGGTFIMNSGEISGNRDSGVYVTYDWFINKDGIFIMNDGKISGNGRSGVYIGSSAYGIYEKKYYGGTFIMNSGEISGNRDSGVYVFYGIFSMKDGEISDNISYSYGGGVYVSGGTFTKTGGNITGSNSANSNIIKDYSGNTVNNKGRAVYAAGSTFEKRKETTAGSVDNLYFSYNDGNPKWSGMWDY